MLFWERQRITLFLAGVLCAVLLLGVQALDVSAQSGVNHSGNGGQHTIQGSLFFPSGRRVDMTGTKIKLENLTSGELTTFTDANGKFGFKNLTAGSYYIVIEATEYYEGLREPVYIDQPSNPTSRSSNSAELPVVTMPRVRNVPIYLQPKRNKSENAKTGVINARLADIPKPALEQVKKASAALEKNETKQAIGYLNEAVKLYPQFAEAYSELGSLYLKTGELDKAEEALRKTLQLNEKNPTAQLNYGIVLLNQRKMYEAEKQLEKAVLADENAATPHMYLGIALLGLNYPDYAEKEFLKAISLKNDEKLAQAHRYLGGIYWKKGNYKQAIEHLEKYLEFVPKAPDAEKVRTTIKQLKEKAK
jgi:Tfp pilus assembly protein PilF